MRTRQGKGEMTMTGCDVLNLMAYMAMIERDHERCMKQVLRQADVILILSERLRAAGLSDSVGENDKPNPGAVKESK